MKFNRLALFAASIGSATFTGYAYGAPLTAQQITQQFNAVITNNFSSSSDVEGRLVAASMTGGATFYNNPNAASAPSAFAAVNAISVTNGVNANVDNGGSVNVQGADAGHFNLNGGGSLVSSPNFTMADFTAPLNALSSSLSALTPNSTINATDPNNFTFVETPGASGEAVFQLSAATLETARNLVFSGSASTIVIDVTGSAFTDDMNFNASTFLNEHVIWNFATATTLSFQGWHGAVLAPDGTVSNSSAMEGFLYAENFNGGGELHDFPFDGSIPDGPAPIPEPNSLIIGSGLLALATVRVWRAQPARSHRR